MKINKILNRELILKFVLVALVLLYLFLLVIFIPGCKTTPNKNESLECYYYRVCVDSKGAGNCGREYEDCAKVNRHIRCKAECREEKSVFKDYGDCWKTLD